MLCLNRKEPAVKVSPWYSIHTNDKYHDNTLCTEGNNIERQWRRSGTGGLPRCAHCARIG